MSNEPLVAEDQLLPSSAQREPAFLERSDIDVRESQVELIAEGRAGDGAVPSLDARVCACRCVSMAYVIWQ